MPKAKCATMPLETIIRGANDNATPGPACATDAGAPLPSAPTTEELEILKPLISALAQMAANDLSATPHSSQDL